MSSSSSSSSCNWRYDVFPSFRGEDVRRYFLSHFLEKLDLKLISAFKDNKIQKGQTLDPVLKQAIKDSRIGIVIFSEHYASSAWCLNEMLEIVKCKDEFNQVVIPIFYNIDPSHVRKQCGDFGKIFKETCLNHNKTEVEIELWRKALTDVANLVGFHSQNWENEAKLIEDIVSDILVKLSLTPSKDFDDFVGIEYHIAEMSSLLDLESKEVRMVGIWGPSGIGKTTIARALFSRLSRHFQGSIFIDRAFISKNREDYRGANSDDYNMKLSLQGNFLSQILGTRHIKVYHLGAVADRLKNQKVLICIDDLDDQVVLEALVGRIQWFGCGSRIIVITKDKHFLRAHGINHIYEVSLPSKELALEMLCRYSFKQKSPPKDFEKLAVEVVRHAGSLPLGINVLGSSLRGREKEYWMEIMPRIRNGLDGKIEKTLRFSYDGIDSEEDKAIFRHIACLFRFCNPIPINYIKLLLADSDLSVTVGLQNLVDKSLIHVRHNNVEMHCLLQEVGRKIARAQSIDEPGKREFLLDSKDIYDVLNENTGTKKVLGISLNIDEIDELYMHESAFKGMCNLRFLKIYTSEDEVRLHLDKSFDYLPPKLKLLSWDKYPMRFLPSKLRLENLVILEMQNSKLEKLWEGDLWLTCLKEMNLWGSTDLKEIPDLSRATNLEKLVCRCCTSLVELPSSTNLNKLRWLDMLGCTNLVTLPSGINLQSLDYLDLNGCSQLKSFSDISINFLTHQLNHTAIEEIPWWIENFERLEIQYTDNCSKSKYVSISESCKDLLLVDFSDSRALVGVASKTDKSYTKLPVLEEASSSLPDNFVPQIYLKIRDCYNLDVEALLQQQTEFKQLILPCEEVPSYFTHKTKGTSFPLTIPLLQTPLSQPFFRLRACAVIVFDSIPISDIVDESLWINCRFKDRLGNHVDIPDHEESIIEDKKGSHLFVFNCWFPLAEYNAHLAEHNYDRVDIQFSYCDDSASSELKEWGIRLLEDYSSAENQLGDSNGFETNEDYMINEIEHSEDLGTCDSTPSPDNSSIFEDVSDNVNKKNRAGDTEEEHGRTSKRIKKILEFKDAENLQLKERLNLEKPEYSNRVKTNLISKSESSKQRRLSIENEEEICFFLPDLNMTPSEEDETL